MDSDGFIPVRYTKKQLRNRRLPSSTCTETTHEYSLDYPKEVALKKIIQAVDDVSQSEYFQSFMSSLQRGIEKDLGTTISVVSRIICYGLGSLCKTSKSIEQFAFLVNLQKQIDVDIEFYDPIFTEVDKQIISEDFKFNVLSDNEEGKRTVKSLSLFYLPHCPHKLSNNLLVANWSPDLLPNCIIVANGFAKILDNKLHPDKASFQFIRKAEPLTVEIGLRNSFVPMDVFNDISIHIFPSHKCDNRDLPQSLWDLPSQFSELENDDSDELIRNTNCDLSNDGTGCQ